MNTVLSTNSATLARVVSMPEWRATVSSSPMARRARPSRGAADPEADGEHQDGERQQLPVDLRRRDVGEDVAAERAGLVDLEPGDELADQLGQAES